MTTLTSSPVAEVPDQLFADAERTHASFRERKAQPTDSESGDATMWRKEQDAREFYADVRRLLEPTLATDAVVVADNASRSPECLEHVRSGGGYRSMPFGGDVEVSLRLGGSSGR